MASSARPCILQRCRQTVFLGFSQERERLKKMEVTRRTRKNDKRCVAVGMLLCTGADKLYPLILAGEKGEVEFEDDKWLHPIAAGIFLSMSVVPNVPVISFSACVCIFTPFYLFPCV